MRGSFLQAEQGADGAASPSFQCMELVVWSWSSGQGMCRWVPSHCFA
ncbi:MAG TPA: hypothetical protein ACQGQF_04020 [Xylella fastidiosa subsp. pauca]